MERREYVLDKDVIDREEAVRACAAVLDVIGGRMVEATIDAYSDYDEALSDTARAAQQRLFTRGRERGSGDPGMALRLRLHDPVDWALLTDFGSWSILATMVDVHGREIACFDDCALSVTFEATETEAAEIASRLIGIAPVVSLEVVHQRRKQAKRDRRRARWDHLLSLFRRST